MDRIAYTMRKYPDNLMLVGLKPACRADVEEAFVGSGFIVDPACHVCIVDNGYFATLRAGPDDGEMELWLLMAWGALREDEKQTWLTAWERQ